ncbi:MAG: CinA family nicotinamide mononucleotide deamidase-related protein [Candidatus Rokubacteria bacterium]|nr:CinA family nicotinamide mononucleotide deamidase-related protein [Candidatus Rokubacteria bacterium]
MIYNGASMQAEIVSIGSELLLGQIVDTNSAVISRHLAGIGLDLYYKTAVGDNLARLVAVLRQALERSEVVITTGGIGPTADDVTREAVALATSRELVFSQQLMTQIEAFFRARGFKLSPSNRRQAFVPRGAIPVENPVGTAPAFIVEVGDRCVITLPGVPREMEHLLVTRVVPYLRERYGLKGEIRLRVLRVVGLGESGIGELLADFMEKGRNPTVGTLAHLGQVDVRIAAKGPDAETAQRLIEPVEAAIRGRLGDLIFGVDAETLEGVILAHVQRLGARVAVAEWGSAGAVADRLSQGLGRGFAGGIVLGDEGGAGRLGADFPRGSSAEVKARILADRVRAWHDVRVGGATVFEGDRATEPPVTVVGLAAALDGGVESREYRFGGDLPSMKIRAATLVLDLLRRTLARLP